MSAQVTQGGCGVSIPGDTPKPSEHDPGQMAQDGPAGTGQVGPEDAWGCFPS